MKLGTSTNLLYKRPDGRALPLEESLAIMHAAGFTSFDLNCYDWTLPGSPLLGNEWEAWIDSVAETAAALDVSFEQCHGYFYPFLSPALTDEEVAHHKELQRRSFACCARLGAQTVVLHPETDYTTIEILKTSKRKNTAYFETLLKETAAYGFAIAVENMCDFAIAPKRKFCATPEELVDFVQDFNDTRLGICWDFEHADIMQQDQQKALKHIGKWLYATHVSDTHSATDNTKMHVLPTLGTINWGTAMAALGQIKYAGVLCFEVHNYANRLPDAIIPTAMKLAWETGQYLLAKASQN